MSLPSHFRCVREDLGERGRSCSATRGFDARSRRQEARAGDAEPGTGRERRHPEPGQGISLRYRTVPSPVICPGGHRPLLGNGPVAARGGTGTEPDAYVTRS
jgi:hypothetical protein